MAITRSPKNINLRKLKGLIQAVNYAFTKNISDEKEVIEEWNYQRINRRKFIADAAKVAAVLSIAGVAASCKQKKISQPRIAIVGAGIAGLNAAYILRKSGILADIYEGSPRAGGRIMTVNGMMGEGLWTEMGGEFIDSTHTDMLQLAQEFQLPLIDRLAPSENGLKECAYYFEGKEKQLSEILDSLKPFAKQIHQDIDSLSDDISFQKYSSIDKKFDEQSIKDYISQIGIKGWFADFIDSCFTAEYGLEINEQSAINFLSVFNPGDENGYQYYGDSDERFSIEGGNLKLIDRLTFELKEQIHYENFLNAVSLKNNKYILTFKTAGKSSVDVEADLVILTLPFTTLREVDIRIPLPDWKINAIKNIGYGTNSKLFAGFNKRIWRQHGYAGYSFSDTDVINGYDNTQMQNGNAGKGSYTIFLGGRSGVECGTVPLDVLQNQYVPQLDKMFPGSQQSYNGNFQRWHWPSYPFSKGSYTAFKVGEYTTLGGAAEKQVDNLFFAGEHCSYEFQGFMNGGANTGRKAANAILGKIKSK